MMQIFTDAGTEGYVWCNRYDSDCCLCERIECGHGDLSIGCKDVRIGDSGAYGTVVLVKGDVVGPGALIDCQGTEACRFATIDSSNVYGLDCNGDRSCEGATINIVDPKPGFLLDCSGMASCGGLTITIEFSGPPPGYMCRPMAEKELFQVSGISCGNEEACQGMSMTINNAGCKAVRIEALNCMQHNACNLAHFDFLGDVELSQCLCGPSCDNAMGISKCFQGLERLLCSDPRSCMAQRKTITNPKNLFKLECSNEQSCQSAQLTFEFLSGQTEPIRTIEAFVFGGMYAGRGGTFEIVNEQGFEPFTQIPVIVTLDRIECGGQSSCVSSTFILGPNVQVKEVICATGACLNCRIKRTAADVGVPCDVGQVTQAPVQVTSAPYVPTPPGGPGSAYVPIEPQPLPTVAQAGPWVPIQ